jgi:hypothetical protein
MVLYGQFGYETQGPFITQYLLHALDNKENKYRTGILVLIDGYWRRVYKYTHNRLIAHVKNEKVLITIQQKE